MYVSITQRKTDSFGFFLCISPLPVVHRCPSIEAQGHSLLVLIKCLSLLIRLLISEVDDQIRSEHANNASSLQYSIVSFSNYM